MDTKTKTMAREAVKSVMDSAPEADVRVCRRAVAGATVLQQGDVYLHCVESTHPRGKETGQRQVAVGSTVGARHVATGPVRVFEGRQLPACVNPALDVPDAEYLGPVVVADDEWTLEHPEHAAHTCPAGTWQVTYQVDPVERRRVLD